MFRDTSLTPDEMELVLHKICNTLKKMAPNEIPPLIYQVLTNRGIGKWRNIGGNVLIGLTW